jgi:hypothetical protein
VHVRSAVLVAGAL